jgi:hypothetical protein
VAAEADFEDPFHDPVAAVEADFGDPSHDPPPHSCENMLLVFE